MRGPRGRIDRRRVAQVLAIFEEDLAILLQVDQRTIATELGSERMQTSLAPFARVAGALVRIFDGDESRIHAWIETPRPELGGASAGTLLLRPGGIVGVEQFVVGMWEGDPL